MNLKATNSVMHQIRGAVEGLPAITAWQAAVLETDEELRFGQSEISSAFYLFELSRCWLPYLAFAISYRGEELGFRTFGFIPVGLPGAPYGDALLCFPHARSIRRSFVAGWTWKNGADQKRSSSASHPCGDRSVVA